MNSFLTILEITIVFIIIVLQCKFGIETRNSIKKLIEFLPSINQLSIEKLTVLNEVLENNNPKEIIEKFDILEVNELELNDPYDIFNPSQFNLFNRETRVLNLISPTKKFDTPFDQIKESLNIYFIKNKGAIADFNLIKDVIERNVDAEDDSIAQSINTPLYLGLMGTMLGIIFGLINLYLIQGSGQDVFTDGISSFLLSVAIAMIASLFGLALTVFNSIYGFKNARKIVETNKNDFYTLIQTELMPLINQTVAASVSTLKDVLIRFNSDFSSNLVKLDKMFAKNYQTISAQASILNSLESIDINSFAKANVKVLKELNETVPNLEKFNAYLNSSDRLISNTENLNNQLINILNRTNNFESIAHTFENKMEESKIVIDYLKTHISKFENNDQILMEWVKKADDSMSRSIVEFQNFVNQQKESIKHMTIKESDLLERAFEENRSYFANLKYLEELNNSNKDIASNSNSIVNIKTELEGLKPFFDKTSSTLDKNSQLLSDSNKKIDQAAESIKDLPTSIKIDVNPFKLSNFFKKSK